MTPQARWLLVPTPRGWLVLMLLVTLALGTCTYHCAWDAHSHPMPPVCKVAAIGGLR